MLTNNEIERKKELQAAIRYLILEFDIPTSIASDVMGCSQSDVSQIKKGRSVRSNARLEAWFATLDQRCCTANQTLPPVK